MVSNDLFDSVKKQKDSVENIEQENQEESCQPPCLDVS